MITRKEYEQARDRAVKYYREANIAITPREIENVEVADFGLNRLDEFGLQLIVYVNTERVCSKEMVLFPRQTCPEHIHPPVGNSPGKEETFRCRWGRVYLYVPGEADANPHSKVPEDKKEYFTAWKEIVLNPGEQYTLYPNTLHWFQAGDDGAVISEFSTKSMDEADIFTDPEIRRAPIVGE